VSNYRYKRTEKPQAEAKPQGREDHRKVRAEAGAGWRQEERPPTKTSTKEIKMTKIEKIHDLLEDIETDVRSQLIKDILATIKDFQDGCPKNQEDGLQAAVEIIQQNYILG
jgi:hypothetical protein